MSLRSDNNTHSWVRISHGSNKFVMKLNNNEQEIPEIQLEEHAFTLSAKDFACRANVSDTNHNLCLFNLVDHASSHMLVPVHIRSLHLYTSSAHVQPIMILTVVVGSR